MIGCPFEVLSKYPAFQLEGCFPAYQLFERNHLSPAIEDAGMAGHKSFS